MLDALALVNIVFIVVLAGLWWSFYDAAHQPPKEEADPLRSLAMPGVFLGLATTAEEAPEPAGLAEALARIARSGGFADSAAFLERVREAYEAVVVAFANGDLAPVAHLLTPAVQSDFAAAIAARAARGETEELTFIGFDAVEIVAAELAQRASVDVRIGAELVSVTRDRDGARIAGRADRVVHVAEVWTFERDMKDRQAPWLLAATDADA
jgi:predicted lipid-binding transport protein (Tim44 family)